MLRNTGSPGVQVDVALVHYPVNNRNGETIGSAVTNLDLHDIARAGKTYGVGTYWVITPFKEQQELAGQIVGHWTHGYGAGVNPDRSSALSIITVCASYADALSGATEKFGEKPLVLATCAKVQDNTLEYAKIRERIWAWGTRAVALRHSMGFEFRDADNSGWRLAATLRIHRVQSSVSTVGGIDHPRQTSRCARQCVKLRR